MQGGIDSTQLPGQYQVPGVGMVSQVPSIPQSAFADSSLCTREVRWPDGSGGRTAILSLPWQTQPAKAKKVMGPASRWPGAFAAGKKPGAAFPAGKALPLYLQEFLFLFGAFGFHFLDELVGKLLKVVFQIFDLIL